jgi:hypothetical protein
VIAAPVWGWTGSTVMRWVHLAPTDADAQIASGFVGAGGRFAFLTYAHADGKSSGQQGHAIRVDLTTGDWRAMGGYAHHFQDAGGMDGSAWLAGSTALPELLLLEDVLQHRYDVVDARSGEILELAVDRIRERVRASKRITTPLRVGGRRAWFQDGTLECDDGSGGWHVASALGPRHVFWGEGPEPPGLAALGGDRPEVRRPRRPVRGPALLRQSGGGVEVVPLDLFRGRTVEKQDLGEGWAFEAALECGWLVRPTLEPHPGHIPPPRPWFLQDPATGTRVPIVALAPDEWLFAVHDDDHVWTISEQDQKRHRGRLFLVDVPNGTREEIRCAGIFRDYFMRIENPGWPMAPAYTPAGSRVYAIYSAPDLYRLARFDERKRELVPALAVDDLELPTSFLALPDEDTAIFARRKHTIVCVHFGSEACEILFPREP